MPDLQSFDKASGLPPAFELFSSEEAIRKHYTLFTDYVRGSLHQHNLTLSLPSYDFRLAKSKDKLRKDGINPAAVHEQRHVIVALDIFSPVKEIFTVQERQELGSFDAFIAAVILHDIFEDNIEAKTLKSYLKRRARTISKKFEISDWDSNRLSQDIDQVFVIVSCLTRNKGEQKLDGGDRNKHMEKLFGHPYAFIIKLIDWNDKLTTMVGVPHFEKNNQTGIIKVLKETADYFQDTRKGLSRIAEDKFHFAREQILALDSIMGLQYNILLHYVHGQPGNEEFKRTYPTSNLKTFVPQALMTLTHTPRGIHYIYNLIDRLNAVAKDNPDLQQTLEKAIWPTLEPFLKKSGIIMPPFQDAPEIIKA